MHRLLDVFNDLLRFSSSLDTLSRNFGHAKNIGTDVVVFYSSRCLNQQKRHGTRLHLNCFINDGIELLSNCSVNFNGKLEL